MHCTRRSSHSGSRSSARPRWSPPTPSRYAGSSPRSAPRSSSRWTGSPAWACGCSATTRPPTRWPSRATDGGRRHVIVQQYLADVADGNKRLFLLDGEIVGAVLRRPSRGRLPDRPAGRGRRGRRPRPSHRRDARAPVARPRHRHRRSRRDRRPPDRGQRDLPGRHAQDRRPPGHRPQRRDDASPPPPAKPTSRRETARHEHDRRHLHRPDGHPGVRPRGERHPAPRHPRQERRAADAHRPGRPTADRAARARQRHRVRAHPDRAADRLLDAHRRLVAGHPRHRGHCRAVHPRLRDAPRHDPGRHGPVRDSGAMFTYLSGVALGVTALVLL